MKDELDKLEKMLSEAVFSALGKADKVPWDDTSPIFPKWAMDNACAAAKTFNPSHIQITFQGVPIIGFQTRALMQGYDPDIGSWEEVNACDLTSGDLVIAWTYPNSTIWCKPQLEFGGLSAGWLVDSTSNTHVLGYKLDEAGNRPAVLSNLFRLDYTGTVKVVPWDAQFPSPHSRPQAAKHDPGLWNGTCAKCGKGVYTGAFKVEHEGGSCLK